MAIHRLHRVQDLPISLNDAWDFFSSPENLKVITPEYMGFSITSGQSEPMYAGQVITYKVKPLLGVPLNWMTEITAVENQKRFVDEQRHGPYALWHHQHYFESIPDGVRMTDLVHYKVPFGLLGDFVNRFFVRRQLNGIFDYRFRKLESLFGKISDEMTGKTEASASV